jgi:2-keto-4-pentenoate hydratase
MSPNRDEIATALLEALDHGKTLASIVDADQSFDWDAAYEVAAELLRRRRARGETPVGRKIGFTNRNIWPQYGATSPIWAHVYDTTLSHARDHAATLSLAGSVQPRIEPEIAFKLRGPLPVGCRDPRRILEAIEWYAPSFEIVDCHFPDWKFGGPDSAADFSLHWRLIVGQPVPVAGTGLSVLADRLRDCRVTLYRGERIADRGIGANALDHPALALAFLADTVARQPAFAPPQPGEIITTGTLTAALPVTPGEIWRSDYAGLESSGITLRFTP